MSAKIWNANAKFTGSAVPNAQCSAGDSAATRETLDVWFSHKLYQTGEHELHHNLINPCIFGHHAPFRKYQNSHISSVLLLVRL